MLMRSGWRNFFLMKLLSTIIYSKWVLNEKATRLSIVKWILLIDIFFIGLCCWWWNFYVLFPVIYFLFFLFWICFLTLSYCSTIHVILLIFCLFTHWLLFCKLSSILNILSCIFHYNNSSINVNLLLIVYTTSIYCDCFIY